MSRRLRNLQTNFSGGQIDQFVEGRNDIGLFKESAKQLKNWRALAAGGVDRRPGTFRVAVLDGERRLIPFEFDNNQNYIFAFGSGTVDIYEPDGSLLTSITITALTSGILWQFTYIQSGDFIFLAHKDMPTQEIQRLSLSTFSVKDYEFDENNDGRRQNIYYKFADNDITLTVTGTGPYTLTASSNWFLTTHIGKHIKIQSGSPLVDRYFEVTGYTSPTVVTADGLENAATVTATKLWAEEAVNNIWGYPQAVCLHAGRMYFGGLNSLPAHIMGSKVGQFWNFDTDDGTDDDAVVAPIDTDRINRIRHITSGKHLQIFTDLSEFHIAEDEGVPITPTSFSIRRNTSYGCTYVRPLVFDDATLFVQHGDSTVREYLWNNLSVGYTSNPLSFAAQNVVKEVKQSAIDYGGNQGPEQYAYFLNTDGTLAVYHAIRNEQVAGFSPWETDGLYTSIAVVNDVLYAIVNRTINGASVYWLECFDSNVWMDAILQGTKSTAVSSRDLNPLLYGTASNGYLRSPNLDFVDGDTFTLSCWYQLGAGTDGSNQYLYITHEGIDGTEIYRRGSDNKWRIDGLSHVGNPLVSFVSTNAFVYDGQWHHFLLAVKTTTTQSIRLFIDGVEETLVAVGGWGASDDMYILRPRIGVNRLGSGDWTGCITEFWYHETFITDTTLFRTTDGKAEWIGLAGEIPAATIPHVYLKDPAATAGTNYGTGQDWLIVGTISDCGGTPPAAIGPPVETGGIYEGLDDYAGQEVSITTENNTYYLGEYTVNVDGEVDISVDGHSAEQLYAGLNYEAIIETLPVNFALTDGDTTQLPKRIVSAIVRILASYDFKYSGNRFESRLVTDLVDGPPSTITGIRRSYLLGVGFDRTVLLVSDIPLSCTVLNLGVEVAL